MKNRHNNDVHPHRNTNEKKVRNHHFYANARDLYVLLIRRANFVPSARIWSFSNDETSCTVSNFPTWFAYQNCQCICVHNFWSMSCLRSAPMLLSLYVLVHTVSSCFRVIFSCQTNSTYECIELLLATIFIFIQKSIVKQAQAMVRYVNFHCILPTTIHHTHTLTQKHTKIHIK